MSLAAVEQQPAAAVEREINATTSNKTSSTTLTAFADYDNVYDPATQRTTIYNHQLPLLPPTTSLSLLAAEESESSRVVAVATAEPEIAKTAFAAHLPRTTAFAFQPVPTAALPRSQQPGADYSVNHQPPKKTSSLPKDLTVTDRRDRNHFSNGSSCEEIASAFESRVVRQQPVKTDYYPVVANTNDNVDADHAEVVGREFYYHRPLLLPPQSTSLSSSHGDDERGAAPHETTARTRLIKSASSHQLISCESSGARDTSVLFNILCKEREQEAEEEDKCRKGDSFFDRHRTLDQLNMSLSRRNNGTSGLRTTTNIERPSSLRSSASNNGPAAADGKTKAIATRRTRALPGEQHQQQIVSDRDRASSSASTAITASSTDDEPTMRLRARNVARRSNPGLSSEGHSGGEGGSMTNNKSTTATRSVPVSSSGDENRSSRQLRGGAIGSDSSHISSGGGGVANSVAAKGGNIRTTKTSRLRAAALGEFDWFTRGV